MRFKVEVLSETYWNRIKDRLTNQTYVVGGESSHSLCSLMNALNDRADRNAELVTISRYDLLHKIDMYKGYIDDVNEILDNHHIDSLEKLEFILDKKEQ